VDRTGSRLRPMPGFGIVSDPYGSAVTVLV
jgi:hypothetical protein